MKNNLNYKCNNLISDPVNIFATIIPLFLKIIKQQLSIKIKFNNQYYENLQYQVIHPIINFLRFHQQSFFSDLSLYLCNLIQSNHPKILFNNSQMEGNSFLSISQPKFMTNYMELHINLFIFQSIQRIIYLY
ncbi:unnamed protein product [Paramecium sonneborni]|uniref:Uncharacterized protein n=1 Tax=Paramecium sonneborni TaxID=65129 RepID=A0A8S1QJK4_9CILI|nr:unnamed protein product [Paramecium sonneborni]